MTKPWCESDPALLAAREVDVRGHGSGRGAGKRKRKEFPGTVGTQAQEWVTKPVVTRHTTANWPQACGCDFRSSLWIKHGDR